VVSFTPRLFYPDWIGRCKCLRAGLDDVKKRKYLTLPGIEFRPLGRPARSQSLYRLRYPGSYHVNSELNTLPSKNRVASVCGECVSTYTEVTHFSKTIYLSIYLSMALQPSVGPWPLFQFLQLLTQSVGLL
jgi:hypothetical protein